MTQKSKNRTKWLHVRLSEDEYRAIRNAHKKTTCQVMSQFVRNKLFDRKIVVTYRNRSIDEMANVLAAIRKELGVVGKNYNQVVRKINSLNDSRTLKHWLLIHDNSSVTVGKKVDECCHLIESIARLWSQESMQAPASAEP